MTDVAKQAVNHPKDPEEWEKEIGKAGIGGAYIFSDGSLLETGCVAGAAFVVGPEGTDSEAGISIGDIATVWDGEVAGIAGGLARARQNEQQRILILSDSKAAIAAVRRVGRTGRARSERC